MTSMSFANTSQSSPAFVRTRLLIVCHDPEQTPFCLVVLALISGVEAGIQSGLILFPPWRVSIPGAGPHLPTPISPHSPQHSGQVPAIIASLCPVYESRHPISRHPHLHRFATSLESPGSASPSSGTLSSSPRTPAPLSPAASWRPTDPCTNAMLACHPHTASCRP